MVESWRALFERSRQIIGSRRQADQELAEAARDFERWCLEAEVDVLARVAEEAQRRAEELAAETDFCVEVHPSESPVLSSGHHLQSLLLELPPMQLYVYTSRSEGSCPWLHLAHAWSRAAWPTLVSLPGCLVARRGEGYELFERATPTSPMTVVTVEKLTLRAFELLVGAALGPTPEKSSRAARIFGGK